MIFVITIKKTIIFRIMHIMISCTCRFNTTVGNQFVQYDKGIITKVNREDNCCLDKLSHVMSMQLSFCVSMQNK